MHIRSYEQKPETEIKYTFLDGHMTREEAKQALIRDAGLSDDVAEEKTTTWDFTRSYPEYSDASESSIGKYLECCQDKGVDPGAFFGAWDFYSNASADKDKDGNSISGSKKAKVLDYIDGLNLTKAQKDSLYYAFGYSGNTLKEDAPWH